MIDWNGDKMEFILENNLIVNGLCQSTEKAIKAFLTLPNPAYLEAERHGRWTGGIPNNLYYFEETDSGLICPRGAARQIYRIAQDHGEPIQVIDHRRVLEPIDFRFNGKLRPYQQKAVDAVLARDSGVLEASTGSGKTVMALATLANRKQPTLILVHTKELLNQWCLRIRSFLGIEAGTIGNGKFDIQPVTVGTVQSVRKHLDTLPQQFGFLVVDECHRTPSSTFTECCEAFDAKYLLGLSATPFRRDGLSKVIFLYLGNRVHRVDPEQLRNIGAVLKPEIVTVETGFRYNYQDDYSKMVSALTCNEQRNHLIVETLKANQNGGTALVVSARIAHLELLANGLSGNGVAVLTGQTPAKEREQIVADLAQGKIKVLFSTLSLISEGFDQTGLHDLFIVSPIKYHGRLIQTVGRVLRPETGKLPRVFDFVDLNQPVLRVQARKRQAAYKSIA